MEQSFQAELLAGTEALRADVRRRNAEREGRTREPGVTSREWPQVRAVIAQRFAGSPDEKGYARSRTGSRGWKPAMVEPTNIVLTMLRGFGAEVDRSDGERRPPERRFESIRPAVGGEPFMGRVLAAEIEERLDLVDARLSRLEKDTRR